MQLRRSIASSLLAVVGSLAAAHISFATTKGLSQIVTPDLQPEGDFSLSFQAQSKRIGNPYELQGELGLTKWAEVAVFKGFQPNELIFGTELGLIQHEPYLLSVGFVNWSPHSHVDPQPFIEAGYCTEHHKFFAGATHVDYRNEAIVGYAYDFNETWRAPGRFPKRLGQFIHDWRHLQPNERFSGQPRDLRDQRQPASRARLRGFHLYVPSLEREGKAHRSG